MTFSLTHKFRSPFADTPDATLLRPSAWNDQHALSGDPNTVLGFDSNGNAVTLIGVLIVPGLDGTILVGRTGQNPGFSATPVLGQAGSVIGTLTLSGNTGGTLTLSPQPSAGNWVFNFPGNAGVSGQGLVTDGAGVTSWGNLLHFDTVDQLISGGANVTATNLGTKSSGTTTIDCGACPLQYLTNNGAFTLAAPTPKDGSCLVLVTNGASAGTITFSGFSVGANTGDALDTVNGHKFTLSIWRINGVSGYRIAAHQ